MIIEFEDNKSCRPYKDLVENPDSRDAIKKFAKVFDKNIIGASVKVYQKLESAPTALFFNQNTSAKNKIEIKSGAKDKEPITLKVRLQDSYRKFFYFYIPNTASEPEFCLQKNWVGQFQDVSKVYVYSVNNHDYSK